MGPGVRPDWPDTEQREADLANHAAVSERLRRCSRLIVLPCSGPRLSWSVDEIVNAIEHGHEFYTRSPSTSAEAQVMVYRCHSCKHKHLQTKGDKTPDNDLKALPRN